MLLSLQGICACDNDERSKDIIPVETMANLLGDYETARALAQMADSSNAKEALRNKLAVFHQYQINEADFHRSMAYYLRHPKELKLIYNELKKQYNLGVDRGKIAENNLELANDTLVANYHSTMLWSATGFVLDGTANTIFAHRLSSIKNISTGNILRLNFDTQWLYRQGEKRITAILNVHYADGTQDFTTVSCGAYQTHQTVDLALTSKAKLRAVEIQVIQNVQPENFVQLVNVEKINLVVLKKRSKDSTETKLVENNDSLQQNKTTDAKTVLKDTAVNGGVQR